MDSHQVSNKLFANEIENNFDIECKIEINEHPIEYVEDVIKGFDHHIQNSDRCLIEEDGDLSSETKEEEEENLKKPIMCDSCPNVYYNHVDLAFHSINHSDNGMYSCHLCKNFSNVEKNYMEMHIGAHEGKEVEVQFDSRRGNSSLIEVNCEENVTSKETEMWCISHYLLVYGQTFDTVPIMMDHIKNANSLNISSHCGNMFSAEPNLNIHLSSHTVEKPFVCTTCGKGFSRKRGLNIHLYSHTGEKPHVCGTCGKGFTENKTLKRHLVTHTGEKPHVCTTCGKGFIENKTLKRHLVTHTEEKPHVCSTCGKGFAQKTSLNIHLRIHTGEKPHICSLCGKEFSLKVYLKVHLRSHTKEKPHICSTCGKRFSQKNSLNIHLRSHTGERPYVCFTCGKGFTQRSHLNSHSRIHTGEKR